MRPLTQGRPAIHSEWFRYRSRSPQAPGRPFLTLPPTATISQSLPKAAPTRSSQSGGATTSASRNARTSPVEASMPMLRAPPAFLRRSDRRTLALAARARRPPRVGSPVGRGVVHDEDFQRRLGLGEGRPDGFGNDALAVPAGNDHARPHGGIVSGRETGDGRG